MPGSIQALHPGSFSDTFELPVQYFLTQAGNNTGTNNLIGNYSAAPIDMYYQSTARYDIHSVLISISDNASFNQLDYGAIVGGITNGVKIFLDQLGKTRRLLLSGYAAKHNYDWQSMTKYVQITSYAGLSQTMQIVFDLVADYGAPLTLLPGEKFGVILNDDFSTLVSQTFGLRGIQH